jgi:hypothetical protein
LAIFMIDAITDSSGIVESLVAADADQRHAAVGKPLLHLQPLRSGRRGLDLVRVRRPQLDSQRAGLLAVRQQRRQVPILAPLIRDQTEGDVLAFGCGGGGTGQRERQGRERGSAGGSGEERAAG